MSWASSKVSLIARRSSNGNSRSSMEDAGKITDCQVEFLEGDGEEMEVFTPKSGAASAAAVE